MSQPIITCDRISKYYRLGANQKKALWRGADHTLTEAVRGMIGRVRDRMAGVPSPEDEDRTFWALRDISLEVGRGEVIGLVGRNGAGKSTLLKILSRIVEPSAGMARIRGRIASLLEVGTGFHPELTGRENIYLNGAILGMKKAEINRKFDEIVAFAEIEKFLDTPTKRYSSGMYVRLAFAVAAHLEPEILVVDEVLAVGDFAFQKKCLGKMHKVSQGEGRTILFVSHNMGTLSQLCDRGILLERGSIVAEGSIQDVIRQYFGSVQDRAGKNRTTFAIVPEKPCQWLSAEVVHEDGAPGSMFSCDEPVIIRMTFELRQPQVGLFLYLSLYTIEGVQVLFSDFRDDDPSLPAQIGVGVHTFEVRIPERLLAATKYTIGLTAFKQFGDVNGNRELDARPQCCEFDVRELSGTRLNRPGVLSLLLPWNHRRGKQPASAGADS